MDKVDFVVSEGEVSIFINGSNLIDMLRDFEMPFAKAEGSPSIAGGYSGLPKDVAEKLSAAVQTALQQAEVKNRLAFFGLSPMPMAPEQLKAFIASEIPKWARMAKDANIQPE